MAVLITWITSAWRESRRLFEATLSSIGDAVLATDREGRVTFLNPVAETLTGWPRKEARGKPASEILKLVDEKDARADGESAGARVARARDGGRCRSKLRWFRATAPRAPIEL